MVSAGGAPNSLSTPPPSALGGRTAIPPSPTVTPASSAPSTLVAMQCFLCPTSEIQCEHLFPFANTDFMPGLCPPYDPFQRTEELLHHRDVLLQHLADLVRPGAVFDSSIAVPQRQTVPPLVADDAEVAWLQPEEVRRLGPIQRPVSNCSPTAPHIQAVPRLAVNDAEVGWPSTEEARPFGPIQRRVRVPIAQKNRRSVAGNPTRTSSIGDSGYCSACSPDCSPPPAPPPRRRSVAPFEVCLGAVAYALPSRCR